MTEEIRKVLDEVVSGNEYIQTLGLEIVEIREGYCKGLMPYKSSLCNPYGSIHGGVLFSMADIVAGLAACTYGSFSSTINGNMNFVQPAMDTEYVVCEAVEVRQGHHVAVYRIEITNDKGDLLQNGSFNFYLMNRPVSF